MAEPGTTRVRSFPLCEGDGAKCCPRYARRGRRHCGNHDPQRCTYYGAFGSRERRCNALGDESGRCPDHDPARIALEARDRAEAYSKERERRENEARSERQRHRREELRSPRIPIELYWSDDEAPPWGEGYEDQDGAIHTFLSALPREGDFLFVPSREGVDVRAKVLEVSLVCGGGARIYVGADEAPPAPTSATA